MPRESTIEKNLARFGQLLELETFKFVSPSNGGVPDRLFIAPDGRVLFLEVKRPGQRPDPRQMAVMRRLSRRVAVTWTDTLAAGQEILRKFAVLKVKPRLRDFPICLTPNPKKRTLPKI